MTTDTFVEAWQPLLDYPLDDQEDFTGAEIAAPFWALPVIGWLQPLPDPPEAQPEDYSLYQLSTFVRALPKIDWLQSLPDPPDELGASAPQDGLNFSFVFKPTFTTYTLNAGSGSFAINGQPAYFSVVRGSGPSFDYEYAYSYQTTQSEIVEFVVFDPIHLVMLVQYLDGVEEAYAPVLAAQAAQLVNLLQAGGDPAEFLSGLTPSP